VKGAGGGWGKSDANGHMDYFFAKVLIKAEGKRQRAKISLMTKEKNKKFSIGGLIMHLILYKIKCFE
jgi:hypothetical protein